LIEHDLFGKPLHTFPYQALGRLTEVFVRFLYGRKLRQNPRNFRSFLGPRYGELEFGGGESVSQSPLKDKAFSIFLDQNPPFELLAENGISPPPKACPARWPVIDNSATKRLAKGKLPSHLPDRASSRGI
jgi:hypothetical protein